MDAHHKSFALIIFYKCELTCDYYTPLNTIATRAISHPNVKYVHERTMRDLERTFREHDDDDIIIVYLREHHRLSHTHSHP
jgi:hypothetical protein